MSERYRRNPRATERTMGGSVFLANPDEGTLLKLNEPFGALWRLLQDPHSLDEAIEVFRSAFPDMPAGQVEDEVAEMFDDLHEEGLIEPCP